MPEPMIPPDVTIYKALEAWELRASDAVDLTAQEMDDLVATVRRLLAAAQDGARALEERDHLRFLVQASEPLVCPTDGHTLGCRCACKTCAQRQRGVDALPPEAGPR